MRASLLAVAVLGGVLAGCSKDSNDAGQAHTDFARSSGPSHLMNPSHSIAGRGASSIASLADRGSLVAYDGGTPVHRGASTWHPAQLSEAYALRSIAEGSMTLNGPNGAPIRLQYERHVEHPDGNWSWIGRPSGASKGTEAVLTFGKNAVFGSIPNGNEEPLQVTTAAGRTWIVETDKTQLSQQAPSADSDFLMAPRTAAATTATTATTPGPALAASGVHKAASAPMQASAPVSAAATASAMTTVDLVVGYTTGFATRLGGQSQALTRLNFMVDVANQAYANSEVAGQVRLVKAIEVNYADNTANKTALFELSGAQCTTAAGTGTLHLPDTEVNCTSVSAPAALQPLLAAREQYHADLVSLVRTFQSPENQSCGVAWLLGGGQHAIDANSAKFGLSVVSDSSGMQFPDPDNGATCRDETLAHELGHNMGLAHDRVTAAGSDDTNGDSNPLDPEEYGRFPFSFGYNTAVDAGNFYTIMSFRQGTQTGYRVFSNPRITYCGGFACGVANEEDNALTLESTMPAVAAFRATPSGTWLRGDINGDGKSDIVWRNSSTGGDAIWRSGNSATPQAMSAVTSQSWVILGAADFDGDHKADVLWHNIATNENVIWKAGSSATPRAVSTLAAGWAIVGAGDFDFDGKSDLLLRNTSTGANVIWKSASSATTMAVTTVPSQSWIAAGIGDFDGDHRADILWHNNSTGQNVIWKAGNSATAMAVTSTAQGWTAVGVGDFNGDGKADILWRNVTSGQNVIWRSGSSATPQAVTAVTNQAWVVTGIGDFDGDLKADILWRNMATGQDVIWKSGNAATPQAVSAVGDLNWSIVG